MTKPCKISIITASYNKEKFISETITSVLNQTYQFWELLIIDDCSTDNTIQKVESFRDERIKLYKNTKNEGANFCRNIGIDQASGEYIVLLDADDILLPNCLKYRIEKANEYPNANMLIFTMGVFYSKIGDDNRIWKPQVSNYLSNFLSHTLPWSILQPLWDAKFLKSLKGFDTSFIRLQDVEMHTRALLQSNCKVQVFPNILDCYYRIDEERLTTSYCLFLEKWVASSKQYIYKFQEEAEKQNLSKKLIGTVLQCYLSLLYNYKKKIFQKKNLSNWKPIFLINLFLIQFLYLLNYSVEFFAFLI